MIDNWSRWQHYHVGGEISGRVGEILGCVGETFWTRRRNILDTSAKSLDALAKYFGLGSIFVALAAQDWSPRQGSHFGDRFLGHLDI